MSDMITALSNPLSFIVILVSVIYNVYQAVVNSRLSKKQEKNVDMQSQNMALGILRERETVYQSKIVENEKELAVKRSVIEEKDHQIADFQKHINEMRLLIENRSPQLEAFIKQQMDTNKSISDILNFFKDNILKNDEQMKKIAETQNQHTEALSVILKYCSNQK